MSITFHSHDFFWEQPVQKDPTPYRFVSIKENPSAKISPHSETQNENSFHPNALLQLFTPATFGTFHFNKEITAEHVQTLIDQGADVNAQYLSGITPLRALFSLFWEHHLHHDTFLTIAEILIKNHADVNAKMNTAYDQRSLLQTVFSIDAQIMAFGTKEKIQAYFGFLQLLLVQPTIKISANDKYLLRTIHRGAENPAYLKNWEEIAEVLIKKHSCVTQEKDPLNKNPYEVRLTLSDLLKSKPDSFDRLTQIKFTD